MRPLMCFSIAITERQQEAMKCSRLEELCRELQKQNKDVMASSQKIAKEADRKGKEMSKKFDITIQV